MVQKKDHHHFEVDQAGYFRRCIKPLQTGEARWRSGETKRRTDKREGEGREMRTR